MPCLRVRYALIVGDAKDILNATSDRGADLFHAEFHADFRSGLHFDLRGCISEHKSNFYIEFKQVSDETMLFFWGDFEKKILQFIKNFNLYSVFLFTFMFKITSNWGYFNEQKLENGEKIPIHHSIFFQS